MSNEEWSERERRKQAFIISYVITVCWVVSFIVEIFRPNYDPPVAMHPLMMIVAGALVTEGLRRPGTATPEAPNKEQLPPAPKPPPVIGEGD